MRGKISSNIKSSSWEKGYNYEILCGIHDYLRKSQDEQNYSLYKSCDNDDVYDLKTSQYWWLLPYK